MHHLAYREHIAAVGDFGGKCHVLFHQQDTHAALTQRADGAHDLLDHQRRQPGGRLIQNQQLRLQQQCPRQRNHLLFASTHEINRIVDALAQEREQRQRVFDTEAMLSRRDGARAQRAERQVLAGGHIAEQVAAFKHHTDPTPHALVCRQSRDVRPLMQDAPGSRRHQSAQRGHQRALARAVGADHGHGFSGSNAQRHIAQHRNFAVTGSEIFDVHHVELHSGHHTPR